MTNKLLDWYNPPHEKNVQKTCPMTLKGLKEQLLDKRKKYLEIVQWQSNYALILEQWRLAQQK
jgi:hypothetical protein